MTMTVEEAQAAWNAENEPEPLAPNVIQAIARVIRDMPPVPKDREMTDGPRYHYRGIEDVTAAIQHLMGVHCVVPTSKCLSRQVEAIQKGGKPWTRDNLEIVFTLYGPGGTADCVEVGPFWGIGEDNADKGTNKAETQAFKQMLLQVFVVGDQPSDPDTYASEGRDAHAPVSAAPAQVEPNEDEKAQAAGWENVVARREASDRVKADLGALVDAGKITREQGLKAWKDYNEPDGKPAARSAAQHRDWYREVIAPLKGDQPAPAPVPAPPPTVDAAEESKTKRVDKADVPDNGYRDHLEEIYKAQGPEEVESFVADMESADVSKALVARGADGMGSGSTLRNRLSKIVNRRAEHDVMTSGDDEDPFDVDETP